MCVDLRRRRCSVIDPRWGFTCGSFSHLEYSSHRPTSRPTCLNPYEEEREVARQNSSGLMSLRTKTGRCVIAHKRKRQHTKILLWQNYLGHSINAPTGRWQKNKDVHWYNRDHDDGEAERLAEIKRVKEAEADALAVALYVSSRGTCRFDQRVFLQRFCSSETRPRRRKKRSELLKYDGER